MEKIEVVKIPVTWQVNLIRYGCNLLIIFYFYQNNNILIYKKIEINLSNPS
jgi:hypothetical protein